MAPSRGCFDHIFIGPIYLQTKRSWFMLCLPISKYVLNTVSLAFRQHKTLFIVYVVSRQPLFTQSWMEVQPLFSVYVEMSCPRDHQSYSYANIVIHQRVDSIKA